MRTIYFAINFVSVTWFAILMVAGIPQGYYGLDIRGYLYCVPLLLISAPVALLEWLAYHRKMRYLERPLGIGYLVVSALLGMMVVTTLIEAGGRLFEAKYQGLQADLAIVWAIASYLASCGLYRSGFFSPKVHEKVLAISREELWGAEWVESQGQGTHSLIEGKDAMESGRNRVSGFDSFG
jgi:hypothetical protein